MHSAPVQVEGTSAVLAACDTLLQLSHLTEGNHQACRVQNTYQGTFYMCAKTYCILSWYNPG